jgi:hypothetical protein
MQRETAGGWVPGCEQDTIDAYPTEDFCYDSTQGMPGPGGVAATANPTPPTPVVASWQQIFYEDFEDENLVIDPAGGKESKISNKFAHTGQDSLELKKDTSNSIGTSDNFPVSAYQEVMVDFWYYFKDTNSGDEFYLEWSSNNGSSWNSVKVFVEGVDANEGVWTNPVVSWSVANASTLRLRFRAAIAEKNVYIDEVKLFGR